MIEPFRSWLASFQRAEPPQTEAAHSDATDDLHIDEQGVLHGDRVIYLQSKRGRTSTELARGEPLGVVAHWTATARGTGLAIARSWATSFAEHSAHATIDVVPSPKVRVAECKRLRDAGLLAQALAVEQLPATGWVIYQSRRFRESSWHAGSASAAKINGRAPNDVTIGIEHCCYGRVARRIDNQWRAWVDGKGIGYGAVVAPAEVAEIGGRAYHTYAPEILAARDLLYAELERAYPSLSGEPVTITPSATTTAKISIRNPWLARWAQPKFQAARLRLGHGMLDPTRKAEEPGPLF